MKARLSSKTVRKMEQNAKRGEWRGLVELPLIPAFAAWLTCQRGYMLQSPSAGEALVAYKDGWTIRVMYDGKRTRCGRHEMALWRTFEGFCLGRQ